MSLRGPPAERTVGDLLSFGVLNCDKPPGPSSHQVAAWVRDLAADAIDEATPVDGTAGDGPAGDDDSATGDPPTVDRVAHGGTLDPKVTGCLPMLLGDAARAAQVFDDATKEYVTILELHDRAPPDFEAVVGEFEGKVYQTPPRKSAVVRERRVREIRELEVLEQAERRALLRIRCESGTYVRKLCHHLGLALGTGAHMGELRRTQTGEFDDRTLVTLHDFVDALAFWVEDGDEAPLRDVVQPAEVAFDHLPNVVVAPSAAREIAEGAQVYAPGVIEASAGEESEGDAPAMGELVVVETPDAAAVALGHYQGGESEDSGTVVTLERVLV